MACLKHPELLTFPEHILLALTLVGECFGEPIEGQVAVANVIRNRVKYWKRSYPSIVFQHSQRKVFAFSCWGTKEDYLYDVWLGKGINHYEKKVLQQIYWISEGIVSNRIVDNVDGADHYYAYRLLRFRPWWAKGMKKIKRIGGHLFLRSDRVQGSMIV
jgi:spore germination cell wall hydrolase CwlJ-like protein